MKNLFHIKLNTKYKSENTIIKARVLYMMNY